MSWVQATKILYTFKYGSEVAVNQDMWHLQDGKLAVPQVDSCSKGRHRNSLSSRKELQICRLSDDAADAPMEKVQSGQYSSRSKTKLEVRIIGEDILAWNILETVGKKNWATL